MTDGKLHWGILTNGRIWRLYYQKAQSRAEDFLEIDLAKALELDGFGTDLVDRSDDARVTPTRVLKLFVLLFGHGAFLPANAGRSFHDLALEEGRKWEERVAEDLSKVIFQKVFPRLVSAIPDRDKSKPSPFTPDYLEEVREGALILLYRLLFVLFAEDRNLLPDEKGPYKDYSLTTFRLEIADAAGTKTYSDRATIFWARLKGVFAAINEGDNDLRIPPYNGGLFTAATAPILDRCELSDAVLADVIFGLSHELSTGEARYINYRDLTVQQLGSIYERILEYTVVAEQNGLGIRLDTFARKGSGSYYTPDDLVRLIIEETVGPLVGDRLAIFFDRCDALASDRRRIAERARELTSVDPASALLDLKICDPAMGSGHFLVSLVDWLADRVLETMARCQEEVHWTDEPYRSPLADRIADIRSRIVDAARINGWPIVEDQLEDRHIVRRMILKRVIYGVDKNPMAVELAKVALWLHTFTVGAPLSFLDHHLRCGDSLFGERVRPMMDQLEKRGTLLINQQVQRAKAAVTAMEKIEQLTDADVAEVRSSATNFADVEEQTRPLVALMGFMHALRWIEPRDVEGRTALDSFFDGSFGDPMAILCDRMPSGAASRTEGGQAGKPGGPATPIAPPPKGDPQLAARLAAIIDEAATAVAEQKFFHWQIAYPGVWSRWESLEPAGGFDAVIGNPHWDRLKFQEVEWFAARKPEIALASRASDRKRLVAGLKTAGDPLALEHDRASHAAETAARVARSCGEYPLLSGGDTNIYCCS